MSSRATGKAKLGNPVGRRFEKAFQISRRDGLGDGDQDPDKDGLTNLVDKRRCNYKFHALSAGARPPC